MPAVYASSMAEVSRIGRICGANCAKFNMVDKTASHTQNEQESASAAKDSKKTETEKANEVANEHKKGNNEPK